MYRSGMGISLCALQVRSSRKRRHRPLSTAAGMPQRRSRGISGPHWLPMPLQHSSVSGPGPSGGAWTVEGPTFRRAWIGLLHLPLHHDLLLCATRRHAPRLRSGRQLQDKPFSLLRALGGPRCAAGSAEGSIARLPLACSGGGRAAGMTADRIRTRGCAVSWPQRRTALGGQ